jgi:segregation and condensation protein B
MADTRLRQPLLEVSPAGERASALEALLFVSAEPEEPATLAAALGWPLADVRAGLLDLERMLHDSERGVMLQRDGERVQLVTAPRFGAAIARLLGMERTTRLSSAALETLALVAYRQPLTRAEIEAVRGVDSSGVVATLVARELIEAAGRRATPGNPVEYVTTATFLRMFGLASLEALPGQDD